MRPSRVVGLWSLVLVGCASRTLEIPTDPGTALPDYATVHAQVSNACAGVRTFTAELALSGRAGRQRVSGRALAGFQAPDAMRLEGLAPIGAPAFILAARDGRAILLLPRDDRVLRDAAPEEILGALTGVTLAPADLQAILTGCVVPSPRALRGWQHGPDWRSLELSGGAIVYLRRTDAGWQVRAAKRAGWDIAYDEWQGSFPRGLRLRSDAPGAAVDVTARISQLETNVAIDPAAFTVDAPADALPITLEELRDAGPLRGASSSARSHGGHEDEIATKNTKHTKKEPLIRLFE